MACFIIAIGLTACRHTPDDFHDVEKEKIANVVLRKAAAKLKEETELSPIGDMGQMLKEIQKLGLSFYCYKSTDIIEGRKLLIKAVDTLLSEINEERRIHPYLIRTPFLPRNIEIEIYIRSPDGHDVPPGKLCIVEASNGFLRYDIRHPTKRRFITVYKETYDQAIERLIDPSLTLVPYEPSPEINQQELEKVRKNISFVDGNGVIWHLDTTGRWVADPRSVSKK